MEFATSEDQKIAVSLYRSRKYLTPVLSLQQSDLKQNEVLLGWCCTVFTVQFKIEYTASQVINYHPPCQPYLTNETLQATHCSFAIAVLNVLTDHIPQARQLRPSQLRAAIPCPRWKIIPITFAFLWYGVRSIDTTEASITIVNPVYDDKPVNKSDSKAYDRKIGSCEDRETTFLSLLLSGLP